MRSVASSGPKVSFSIYVSFEIFCRTVGKSLSEAGGRVRSLILSRACRIWRLAGIPQLEPVPVHTADGIRMAASEQRDGRREHDREAEVRSVRVSADGAYGRFSPTLPHFVDVAHR